MSESDEQILSKDTFTSKLYKKGKYNKGWKERYFIVYRMEQRIEYYSKQDDAAQKKDVCGTIDLSTVSKIDVISKYDIILVKQLPEYIGHNDKKKSDKDFTFELYADNRTFVFAATDKSSFFQWLKYLKSCLYGAIVKQGWLKKLGNVHKKWKRRYFVLNKYRQMKYFEDSKKTNFLGFIDCKSIISVTNGKIYANDLRYTLELNTKQRIWIIAAQDKDERLEWARLIDALQRDDWKQQLEKIEEEEEKNKIESSTRTIALNQGDNGRKRKSRTSRHSRNISTARIQLLQQSAGITENDDEKRPHTPTTPMSPVQSVSIATTNDGDMFAALTPVTPKLPKGASHLFLGEMPTSINMDDVESNICLKRIIYVFKRYKEWLLKKNENGGDSVDTKTMYEEIHQIPNYGIIPFLNDYYHLLINYENKLEQISKFIVFEIDEDEYDLESIQCKRHFRDRSDGKLRDKLYFAEENSLEISCQQIIDKVYCHFIYTFDLGFKFTASEKTQLQSIINENNKTNHDNNDEKKEEIDDKLFKKNRIYQYLYKISKQKRENLKSLLGKDRLNNNKFIHKIEAKEENKGKENIENVGNFGVTFYYWQYYENIGDLQDAWSPGKTFSDLYIEQNYMTLKLELLNNNISQITVEQFNDLNERVKIYSKTDEIRKLKANGSKVHEFKIRGGSPLSIEQITAILIYCNFNSLRDKLCSTYRKIDNNESFEDIKKRHTQFSHMGRLLREVVSCFTQSIGYKQVTMYAVSNQQIFFNDPTHIQFKNPLSVTTEYNVILNYCIEYIIENNGLVMDLKCGELTRKDHLSFFDCKLLTDFDNESEKLLIGGLGTLIIENIIKYKLNNDENILCCDYRIYIQCVNILRQFVLGKTFTSQQINETEKNLIQKMLIKLIGSKIDNEDEKDQDEKDKDFDIGPYINHLFDFYCQGICKFHIDLNAMNNKNNGYFFLRSLFINEEYNSLKLDVCLALFINIKEVIIENDFGKGVLKPSVILTDSFMENMIEILKTKQESKLNKIEIYYPDEGQMKLQDAMTKYGERLTDINWTISTSETEKRDISSDLGRSYMIKIMTVARD